MSKKTSPEWREKYNIQPLTLVEHLRINKIWNNLKFEANVMEYICMSFAASDMLGVEKSR